MSIEKGFTWVPFYKEFSEKLAEYNDKRYELYLKIKEFSENESLMKYFKFEKDDWWKKRDYTMDPFSVLGIINRGITLKSRIEIAKRLKRSFDIKAEAPVEFLGIPILNNMRSFFTDEAGILWDFFLAGIDYADTKEPTQEQIVKLSRDFDRAKSLPGNGVTYLSMGLFWFRPETFMPLDKNCSSWIEDKYSIKIGKIYKYTGADYLSFLTKVHEAIIKNSPEKTIYEISHEAWLYAKKKNNNGKPPAIIPSPEDEQNEYTSKDIDKNIILYGAPGTGKTYSSIQYAVSIVENKEIEEVKREEYKDVFDRFLRYKEAELIAFTTFHQSYSYEEFIEGIRPIIVKSEDVQINKLEYEIHNGVFKSFCEKSFNQASLKRLGIKDTEDLKRVFIIDEINRGNVSKIFGELITLIEPSKRIGAEEGLEVRLPYSNTPFGVPQNIYIIGTMNTADRSIALIDTALRRRFIFVETLPEPDIFKDISVQGVDIEKLLEVINKRITILLDREHVIGHSFFLPLLKTPDIETLAKIFEHNIIPLLQEYFYDDYEKIRLILGDNQKNNDESQFIVKRTDSVSLFGNYSNDFNEYYEINKEALLLIETYEYIK